MPHSTRNGAMQFISLNGVSAGVKGPMESGGDIPVGFYVFEQRPRKRHASCLNACHGIKYSSFPYTSVYGELMGLLDPSRLSTLLTIIFLKTANTAPPLRRKRGRKRK